MSINQTDCALKVTFIKYKLAYRKFQNIFQVYVAFIYYYSMNKTYYSVPGSWTGNLTRHLITAGLTEMLCCGS